MSRRWRAKGEEVATLDSLSEGWIGSSIFAVDGLNFSAIPEKRFIESGRNVAPIFNSASPLIFRHDGRERNERAVRPGQDPGVRRVQEHCLLHGRHRTGERVQWFLHFASWTVMATSWHLWRISGFSHRLFCSLRLNINDSSSKTLKLVVTCESSRWSVVQTCEAFRHQGPHYERM